MKSRRVGGYTIVEVIIVLAVTSMLFAAVISTFSGRQAKTQATQSARDMETELKSISNDVYSGSFPTGLTCTVSGTAQPIIAKNAAKEGGSNKGCVFLGKIVVFEDKMFKVYSVVGKQFINSSSYSDVASLYGDNGAKPVVVRFSTDPTYLVYQYDYQYGTTAKKVERITADGNGRNFKAIAYFHQLSGGALTSGSQTGSRGVDLYGITFDDAGTFQPLTTPIDLSNIAASRYEAVEQGVRVCLEAGNGERGELILGGSGGSASTFINWGSVAEANCNA